MVNTIYKSVLLLIIIAISPITILSEKSAAEWMASSKIDEEVKRNVLISGFSEFLVISNDLNSTYEVIGPNAIRVFKEFEMILAIGDLNLIGKLVKEHSVVKIVPNFKVRTQISGDFRVFNLGNDELKEGLYSWGRSRVGARVVSELYNLSGSDIVVAILDTGISLDHDELREKLVTINPLDDKYPGGWIEFDRKGMPICSVPRDTHFHGTWVSSIVAGEFIGIAPNVRLMHGLILHGGEGTAAQLLAGLEWVLNPYTCVGVRTSVKPNIVSLSLGISGNYSDIFLKPISRLIEENIIVVASIGNDGPGTTSNPGNIWGVIGVGALNRNDEIADFSSSEVVEWPSPPGEWPFKGSYPKNYVKPDFISPGVMILGAYVINGYYLIASGTSASAPIVTGVIALVLEALKTTGKGFTVSEVYDIINATSEKSCNVGRCGWGVVNAIKAASYALGRSLREVNVSVSPKEVEVFDNVTLTSQYKVTFFIDDLRLSSGNMLVVSIPILDMGYHFIHAVDEEVYGYAKIFVNPSIILENKTLVRGGCLELTILGFPGASEVLIYLNDNLLTYQPLGLLGWKSLKLLLPYLNPGVYSLLVMSADKQVVFKEDIHVRRDESNEEAFILLSLAPTSQYVNSAIHVYVVSLINNTVREPRKLWYEFLIGEPTTTSGIIKIVDGVYFFSFTAATPGVYVVVFNGEIEVGGSLITAATAVVTNLTRLGMDIEAVITDTLAEVSNISSKLELISTKLSNLSTDLHTINTSYSELRSYVHTILSEVLYLKVLIATAFLAIMVLSITYIKHLKRPH